MDQVSLWFIIKHKYHYTICVTWCEIFSDSLVGISMWLFAFKKKTRWYEGCTVLYLFVELLVPLGYLNWEHLGLRLSELWHLILSCTMTWCWEHLLGIHLKIQSACCLAWNLEITLTTCSTKFCDKNCHFGRFIRHIYLCFFNPLQIFVTRVEILFY